MGSLPFAVVMVFITVAAAGIYIGDGILKARAVDRFAALRRSREQLLERSFAERAIAPIFERLGRRAIRLTPAGWVKRTQQRLVLAGWSDVLDVNGWAAIKALSLGGSIVAWVILQGFLTGGQKVITLGLLLFLGWFGPDGVMNNRIEERRKAMRLELPDLLDLLVISVEAGLGFEAALARVVATMPGVMSDEFQRMLQETRVGVSRADAMRHLATRTDLDELRSFLLAMGQAETFGVSVSRVLRVQADEMRTQRRQRAQERAFAAPVKMVFPLVLCIFPSLFLVLLGPAAIEVFRNLVN